MHNSTKNDPGIPRKMGWNIFILIACGGLIILIFLSLRTFAVALREMNSTTDLVENTESPTNTRVATNTPITLIYETPVLVTVVIPRILGPSTQQQCIISAGRYVCWHVPLSANTSSPLTAVPSATSSPTSTSTPTPTATATVTFTPTATSTPTPNILELPQTRAGLSILSTLCLTTLLIGILVSISSRRSKP